MAKKQTGPLHNKIASLAIILLGLLFFIPPILSSYWDNFIRIIFIIGLILIVLGGILFKKSFSNKK